MGCILVIFTALMFSFKSNRLSVRAVLVLISIALIKVVYDVVYLKLTLYHVLVLMLLFILIGVLSIEKKSSINS